MLNLIVIVHCIRTLEAGLSASLMGAGAEVALQASLLPLL